MMDAPKRLLNRCSAPEVIAMSLALVAVIGGIDHLTGHEISVSVFYLFPIALATGYAPPPAGSAFCILSAVVWMGTDVTDGRLYTQGWILVWNAAVRLGFFLVTARLLGTLKTTLRRETAMSRTDSLTQVLNPRGFREVGDLVFQLSARHRHPVALAYIDLDNFKGVNDTLGHSVGDRVLQDVAGTLVRSVRASDAVGRLGGDEFAVLMPETGLKGAQTAFAKIRSELMRDAAARKYPVGFSIGVAVFPSVPASLDQAIKAADDLMYRVKASGKNNWVCEEQPAPIPDPERDEAPRMSQE